MGTPPAVRFGVIGLDHPHIFEMTSFLIDAGAQVAAFQTGEEPLAAEFTAQFPMARRAAERQQILEDPSIGLIASAAVSVDRAEIGFAAMLHGKDFLSDKPAFTRLEDLEKARRVQRETGRIYAIDYGERLRNRAMTRASELVTAGAIGRVLQTIGVGPHRLGAHKRPDWFFQRDLYGGILTDIGAHQADHFLHFTGSTSFQIVASQVGNLAHPETPQLEDFGDVLVRGNNGSGYFRVDWFTPGGLASWGDGRVTILGTDGFLEVRKNIDIAGRPGGSHLFLVDQTTTQYIDCSTVDLPFGPRLLDDIRNRTSTAQSQDHAFLAAELALRAELGAQRLTAPAPLAPAGAI